jgi:hypothetical protein
MSVYGTFTTVATKEAADFYVVCGYPKEMAEKLVGTKSTMKTVDMGDEKKLAWHFSIEGHPEMGACCVTHEGVPNHVNLPHMGGKCVVHWNKTGKNTYHNIIESEKMGKWILDEEYTEEGIKSTLTKDGKSFTECWKRVVCVDGLYKYKSNTGLKEYMTKSGYPESIINNMDDFKMALKATDEGLTVWESWGEVTNTFSCKFDEETTYKMPFEGMPDAKVVITHNGTGKYSWVLQTPDGNAEEWKLHCCDQGMKMCGRNLKSGDAATVEMYKETLPILGTWKTVSLSGAKEMYKLLGVPDAQAQELINEVVELCIDEKGPLIRWNWKSKFMPMDMTFKLNEETDVYDPMLKETTKNVATKAGNVLDIITVSSQGTWHTKCTVGHTFMVFKSCLKGLECMPMTFIFSRQC